MLLFPPSIVPPTPPPCKKNGSSLTLKHPLSYSTAGMRSPKRATHRSTTDALHDFHTLGFILTCCVHHVDIISKGWLFACPKKLGAILHILPPPLTPPPKHTHIQCNPPPKLRYLSNFKTSPPLLSTALRTQVLLKGHWEVVDSTLKLECRQLSI